MQTCSALFCIVEMSEAPTTMCNITMRFTCEVVSKSLTGGIPHNLLILQEVFPSLLVIFLVLKKLYSLSFAL